MTKNKNRKDRELLFSVTRKDCKFEYMKNSKGAGGQARDKTSSACRVTHPPSGAVGFCQEFRQQSKNRSEAFRKMANTKEFNLWRRLKVCDMVIGKKSIDEQVDKLMADENILIEVKEKGGKWTKVKDIK